MPIGDRLHGLTAVVIGGTGTLCGEMACGLATYGTHVYIVGRNESKARGVIARADSAAASSAAAGGVPHGPVKFVTGDATSKTSLTFVLNTVLSQRSSVDILVNGAGVNSAVPFFDIPEADIDTLLAANFKSVLFACQVFGKHMKDRGSGTIINIGSMSALGPLTKVCVYSATKAAVHNLTKFLAKEFAPAIRVNTLVPGFFPAEQNKAVLTPERVATILAHTPLGRFGEPQDLLAGLVYLADPDASRFVTGSELVIDGGFAAFKI